MNVKVDFKSKSIFRYKMGQHQKNIKTLNKRFKIHEAKI